MTRLLGRAVLVGVVTAIALTQLQDGQVLLAWEALLIAIVIWQMREIPAAGVIDDPPLLDISPREDARLPRGVSSAELTVIDALIGHLGPDRRLRPALMRIAIHRLHKRGIDFDTEAAVRALGQAQWSWLADPTDEAPRAETLESVVSRLERL